MKELIPMHSNRKSFYVKAMVEECEDGYYLYSYGIEVFMIPFDDTGDDDEVNRMKLLCKDCSDTTYRHIREFIRQYASEWQKENLSELITIQEIESFI